MKDTTPLTITDIINSFKYEGIDISNYINKINVIRTGESGYSTNERPILATTFTFSCTNLLIYNDYFSYLVHMDPAETTGIKDTLSTRIDQVINLINTTNQKSDYLNIMIVLGVSNDNNHKKKFHDLNHLHNELIKIVEHGTKNNIQVNLLPVQRSKYLLYDYKSKMISIDSPNKEKVFNINSIETDKRPLNQIIVEKPLKQKK